MYGGQLDPLPFYFQTQYEEKKEAVLEALGAKLNEFKGDATLIPSMTAFLTNLTKVKTSSAMSSLLCTAGKTFLSRYIAACDIASSFYWYVLVACNFIHLHSTFQEGNSMSANVSRSTPSGPWSRQCKCPHWSSTGTEKNV